MSKDYSVRYVIHILLFLWGITESLYGFLQVFGLRYSSHSMFAMTGHFENPGPYGGFVACTTAVAVMYVFKNRNGVPSLLGRMTMGMAIASAVIGLIVLPASMSRSAWFGFFASILVLLFTDSCVRAWMRRNIVSMGCVVLVFLVFVCGSLMLKKDSALGRLHIWHMELIAIKDAPVCGYGKGLEMGTYGKTQEQFFRAHLDDGSVSESIIRVAGCPEYPFNEYLGVALAYGTPAMLIVFSIVLMSILNLWRRGSPMAAGLTTLAIFALASYPMTLWQFWVLLGFFVTDCGFPVCGSRLCKVAAPIMLDILVAFAGIHAIRQVEYNKDNGFRRIYDVGYSLHRNGEWERSNREMAAGASMSSDPMFHVIMGKNYEAMGDYERAEEEYWKARYMVPCRIYPLVRIMRLQICTGRNADALETAEIIADMPVNERLLTMVSLKQESIHTRDSLKTLMNL